jgi:hypothetical protein
MSAGELGRTLWDAPILEDPEAEERGRRIVAAAYAERQDRGPADSTPEAGRPGRRPMPRLALGLALATLLAGLLLTPAGAAVRDWVDNAFTSAPPPPEPTLARIPGGGRLLVQSGTGPWVVQPDGSRQLLGDYEEATWSPHGLFVAAVRKRRLSALEPDGSLRWSITAAARAATPRWSPSGERIAYRSGYELRTIAGDGSEDRLVAGPNAATSPALIAPAWSPHGDDALAYLTGNGRIRVVDGQSGAELAQAPALGDVTWIEWGAGGKEILEASRGFVRVRSVRGARPVLGHYQRLPIAKRATVVGAALAPRRPLVAVVLTHWKRHGTYSTVTVYGPEKRPRLLLTAPGSLGHDVTWSPDGRRLLVPWPGANQWLFLPLGRGQASAVADISRTFKVSFPRVEAWCCRR